MNIAYFNGMFIPKDEIKISPDDRGFLFADGIYEVVRWYMGGFYDMSSHLERMKRSLKEIRLIWPEADSFPSVAEELIKLNRLEKQPALVYFQVTRGAAPRTHNFPLPGVKPTVYGFAKSFIPDPAISESGVKIMLKKEMRWSRCDIKSVALLPNTLSFQEAKENGYSECIFVRDGVITEGCHSNIFFVINNTLYTHPESQDILSGITRNNVLRIARELKIPVNEQAVTENMTGTISEAFLTGTGLEITPIINLGELVIGKGQPGVITKKITERFSQEVLALRG